MFRLLVILGAGLFLILLIGGRDAGQTRFGLQGTYDIAALKTRPAQVDVAETAKIEPVPATSVARATPEPSPPPASTPSLTQISFAPAAGIENGVTQATGLTLSLPLVQKKAPPVAPATGGDAVTGPDPLRIGRVIGSKVNLREQPSAKAAVLDRLVRGDEVTVISTNDTGWSLVRIEGDGAEGYIASRYLAEDGTQGTLFPSE